MKSERYSDEEMRAINSTDAVLPVSKIEQLMRFDDLNEQLSAHEGQLFSVVTREWHLNRGLPGRTPNSYDFKYRGFLGVATAPFVENQQGHLQFYTPAYVFQPGEFDRLNPSMRGHKITPEGIMRVEGPMGPIRPNGLTTVRLNNPLHQGGRQVNGMIGEWVRGYALEVVVGDEAVREWREAYAHNPLLMEQYGPAGTERLKKDEVFGIYEEYGSYEPDRNSLAVFKVMQEMLGKKPLPLTESLSRKIEEFDYNHRIGILLRLDTLNDEMTKLFGKEEDTKKIRVPRMLFPGEDPRMEDQYRKDDKEMQMIARIPLLEKQRQMMAELKNALVEAQKLGLYTEGAVFELHPVAGKTVTYDSYALLQGIHQRFEIPIPKTS